jgi:hypothetical protein
MMPPRFRLPVHTIRVKRSETEKPPRSTGVSSRCRVSFTFHPGTFL